MNQKEEGGILQRLRESPRTVTALVIILIAAAAIYAFSGREEAPEDIIPPVGDNDTVAVVDENNDENEDVEEAPEEDEEEEREIDEEPAPREERPVALPEPTRTDQGFVEVAQRGEGVTHLARRTAAAWLDENEVDYEVTDEHRIYIEDYIQKRTSSQPLDLGEQVEISFDLIAEAVDSARDLTDSQLQNLSQYTHALR